MAACDFHEAAIAGAGTGKTYSLVESYLSALFGFDQSGLKKRPQEILALTFTEKAALEMRLRITKRLSYLLSHDHPDDPLFAHAHACGMKFPDKAELSCLMRALPNAQIATFHSFCSSLLKREAVALGIDDRFTILSPKDELAMARNILRPLIIEEIKIPQRKLRSLVARFGLSFHGNSLGLIDGLLDVYGKLWEKNVDPDALIKITRAAAINKLALHNLIKPIEEALRQFYLGKLTQKTKERLDGVRSLLPELNDALNSDDEATIARVFKRLRIAVSGNFGDHAARAALVHAISAVGAKLVDYTLFEEEVELATLMLTFHRAFVQHKAEALVMSYGDLLVQTKNALRHHRAFRKRTKLRYRHILIDEYQDTSPIQQEIVALLCEDRKVELELTDYQEAIDAIDFSNGPSLFVVGDKKQSIYGFRGADLSLFDRLIHKMNETHQASSNFHKRFLTVNRRSSRTVIDLVNLVTKHTLSTQGYDDTQQLKILPDAPLGAAGLFVFHDDPRLDSTTANLKAAAYGTAQLLRERVDLKPDDVVILVRRIKSAFFIKETLAGFNISARIVGGDGFFAQQEVVDLLSALKLMIDPGDVHASSVVLRSPLVLLADSEFMEVAMSDDGLSLLTAIKKAEQQAFVKDSTERLNRFASALKEARSMAIAEGLSSALDVLIQHCDLAYLYGLSEHGEQKWANIEKLRLMLLRNRHNPFSVVEDLYAEIFLTSKEPQAEGPLDHHAVTIMTIHQSKGLEFKVVVVADGESPCRANFSDFLMDENLGLAIRPKNRPIAACVPERQQLVKTRYEQIKESLRAKEEEELVRLLYVALTRAVLEVYVACSFKGFHHEGDHNSLVGAFLKAYRSDAHTFRAICSIIMMDDEKALSYQDQEDKRLLPMTTFEASKGSITRLFASNLSCEVPHIEELMVNKPSSKFRNVDGNLAHQLLASCGDAFYFKDEKISIDDLIDASLRSLGRANDGVAIETSQAVRATVHVLKCTFPVVQGALFEMPLMVEVGECIIEGFADMVVETADFVSVLEFKGSAKRASETKAYLQVLAYAFALSRQFTKPIKFAVVPIGVSKIILQDLNVRWNEILFAAVRKKGEL